jgi:hypothetical protein
MVHQRGWDTPQLREFEQVLGKLCAEASAFASEVGRENLINISVAASGGTDVLGLGGTGVIIVWYWGA